MGNRSEWLLKNPSRKTAYQRKWLKSEKGIAYKKRHAEYMKKWRLEHQEQFHTNQKRCYDKMRLECLQHYSKEIPECACCGETEILFLHIDHIQGNGADHRRTLKAELGYYPGGNKLPYWLKKNNYPDGFQVLCANCNLGKRIAKECPHQRKNEN
jgi:hypothetical protein